MKKVKIMLTAITVFAVVGGALAFKVKDAHFLYCDLNNDNFCEAKITSLTTTETSDDQRKCIDSPTPAPCTQVTSVTIVED
jgi:hypothetical protein